MQGEELERHIEMLSRILPGESTTLREFIEATRDAADKTLNASTEYDADLWWATLRAHALVLYHDWDGDGNPVPPSEPCELCGSYSPPAASQATPESGSSNTPLTESRETGTGLMPEWGADWITETRGLHKAGKLQDPGPGIVLLWLADRVAELEHKNADLERGRSEIIEVHYLLQRENAALQASAAQETKRLQQIIERERSAACGIYDALKREIGSRRGMAESRGSYEWNDDQYRKEFGRALDAIQAKVEAFERQTHARDLSDAALSRLVEGE